MSDRARGRRAGGPDTRGQILASARSSFARKGFGRTTIRAVAADAGVDPALIHHYFGTKDDLFLAALEIGVDPREVVPRVFGPGLDGAAERLLSVILAVWDDPQTGLPLVALVRTSLGADAAHNLLHDGLIRLVFTPLQAMLPADEADRRAQMAATQMLGLVVARYLLRFEPLASMSRSEVVAWVAPSVQRYLSGPLPTLDEEQRPGE